MTLSFQTARAIRSNLMGDVWGSGTFGDGALLTSSQPYLVFDITSSTGVTIWWCENGTCTVQQTPAVLFGGASSQWGATILAQPAPVGSGTGAFSSTYVSLVGRTGRLFISGGPKASTTQMVPYAVQFDDGSVFTQVVNHTGEIICNGFGSMSMFLRGYGSGADAANRTATQATVSNAVAGTLGALIFSVGTVDWENDSSASANFQSAATTFLADFAAAQPGVPIYFVTMPNKGSNEGSTTIAYRNAGIAAAATQSATVIDGLSLLQTSWISNDRIHPNTYVEEALMYGVLKPQIPSSGRIMLFTDSILTGLTNVASTNVTNGCIGLMRNDRAA